ncbi:hypothetical protein BDB01DRAFT_833322 [Pilobolus umbonatus]|nr:hypothetical protein BDB01DRAFT_833322 [Pilobolus umbonatus]
MSDLRDYFAKPKTLNNKVSNSLNSPTAIKSFSSPQPTKLATKPPFEPGKQAKYGSGSIFHFLPTVNREIVPEDEEVSTPPHDTDESLCEMTKLTLNDNNHLNAVTNNTSNGRIKSTQGVKRKNQELSEQLHQKQKQKPLHKYLIPKRQGPKKPSHSSIPNNLLHDNFKHDNTNHDDSIPEIKEVAQSILTDDALIACKVKKAVSIKSYFDSLCADMGFANPLTDEETNPATQKPPSSIKKFTSKSQVCDITEPKPDRADSIIDIDELTQSILTDEEVIVCKVKKTVSINSYFDSLCADMGFSNPLASKGASSTVKPSNEKLFSNIKKSIRKSPICDITELKPDCANPIIDFDELTQSILNDDEVIVCKVKKTVPIDIYFDSMCAAMGFSNALADSKPSPTLKPSTEKSISNIKKSISKSPVCDGISRPIFDDTNVCNSIFGGDEQTQSILNDEGLIVREVKKAISTNSYFDSICADMGISNPLTDDKTAYTPEPQIDKLTCSKEKPIPKSPVCGHALDSIQVNPDCTDPTHNDSIRNHSNCEIDELTNSILNDNDVIICKVKYTVSMESYIGFICADTGVFSPLAHDTHITNPKSLNDTSVKTIKKPIPWPSMWTDILQRYESDSPTNPMLGSGIANEESIDENHPVNANGSMHAKRFGNNWQLTETKSIQGDKRKNEERPEQSQKKQKQGPIDKYLIRNKLELDASLKGLWI